jgi:hypothetical protein
MAPTSPFRRSHVFTTTLALVLMGCGVPDFEFHSVADASVDGSTGGAGSGGTSTGGTGAAGSGATGGTSTGGAAGTGGTGGATCGSHADCTSTPNKPKCDPSSGACVACLEAEDICPAGSYCSVTSCTPGCKVGGNDCTAPLSCDATAHSCLGCTQDDDCPLGQLCDLTSTGCVPGCTAQHACEGGKDCCSGACKILALDPDNCGQCGNQCPVPANGTRACEGNKCVVKCTIVGSADCNKDPADGCEIDTKTDAANCGTCGKTCASGETCSNGACS